jgi:BASS family bile acid:Na+ symporter
MSEDVRTVVRVALLAALFLLKLGQGLEIAPGDLRFFRTRRAQLWRAVAVVTLAVPAAALVVLVVLRPDLPTSVALAILAASPAAPLALRQVTRSGGELAYAASLQMTVAVVAVVTTPLVLIGLGAALGFRAQVRPGSVAVQVLIAQLIPIGLGVLLRAKAPRTARVGEVLARGAGVLLLVIIVALVVALRHAFLVPGARAYGAMFASALAALALGHAAAPPDPALRRALAVEATQRNPGLAMLIATASFPEAKPLPVLLPCVLVAFVVLLGYGAIRHAGRHPGPTPVPR